MSFASVSAETKASPGTAKAPESRHGYTVALAGNPNVGKSTLFNEFTKMHQHTGNWTGKTVSSARGTYVHRGVRYTLVDIPGCYSLLSMSAEEDVARNFIISGASDAVCVVCDATCLERNLNLALQIMEAAPNVILCVNLMDRAQKLGIKVDLEELSLCLGIPVVGTSARNKKGMRELADMIADSVSSMRTHRQIRYPEAVEEAIARLIPLVEREASGRLPARWVSIRLLDGDKRLLSVIGERLGSDISANPEISAAVLKERQRLCGAYPSVADFRDMLISAIFDTAARICRAAVNKSESYDERQLRADRILTRRATGIPVMLLLLAFVFFITIKGANFPSELLKNMLFSFQDTLYSLLRHAPPWLQDMLICGVYRTLAWIVSVMLPPMAIFFPLFTLLEDMGYLPRIAFNLDNSFRKCRACGKQALTICMGFGCNAAGVTGCRIIDSPRERLIAIITNSLVPCNGRLPQPAAEN